MKNKIINFFKLLSFIIISIFICAMLFLIFLMLLFFLWNDGIRHALMLPFLSLRNVTMIVICSFSIFFVIKISKSVLNKILD
jgi:hypothetical protein